MKKIIALIISLCILSGVCTGAMAAETILDLDFSEWEGNIPHKTNVKKDNVEVITFHSQRSDGNSENFIEENGPYGKYLKSCAAAGMSNVAYTFPGQDFGERTVKYTFISYVIRNTNANRVRSNFRPIANNKSNTGFYEWENNKLRLISGGSFVKSVEMDPEKYYHFEFILNCEDGVWDFYLDGVLAAENMKLTESLDWSQGFFYLTIQNYGTDGLPGEIHLDEMKVVFLDGEGVEAVPFAGKYADGSLVENYSSEDSIRLEVMQVVNHENEEKSLSATNIIYTPYGEFSLLKDYIIKKFKLLPGYNRIIFDSPSVPEDGDLGVINLQDSLFGREFYGSFPLEAVKEGNDE